MDDYVQDQSYQQVKLIESVGAVAVVVGVAWMETSNTVGTVLLRPVDSWTCYCFGRALCLSFLPVIARIRDCCSRCE